MVYLKRANFFSNSRFYTIRHADGEHSDPIIYLNANRHHFVVCWLPGGPLLSPQRSLVCQKHNRMSRCMRGKTNPASTAIVGRIALCSRWCTHSVPTSSSFSASSGTTVNFMLREIWYLAVVHHIFRSSFRLQSLSLHFSGKWRLEFQAWRTDEPFQDLDEYWIPCFYKVWLEFASLFVIYVHYGIPLLPLALLTYPFLVFDQVEEGTVKTPSWHRVTIRAASYRG